MANRRDYSGILKKKDHLKPFNIRWSRLPEYLNNTNEEVDALQISNTLVFRIKVEGVEQVIGTPLVVGNKYRVSLDPSDDFSNVGYISDNEYFIATTTTPTSWTQSAVYKITDNVDIMYNNIDALIDIRSINGENSKITITNYLFDEYKSFITTNSQNSSIVDTNNIIFSTQEADLTYTYFKIEVYV